MLRGYPDTGPVVTRSEYSLKNLIRIFSNFFAVFFFRKFAEAVARKLMFAQQVLKDQNCNFSSFENSGEDLINEVSVRISDLKV